MCPSPRWLVLLLLGAGCQNEALLRSRLATADPNPPPSARTVPLTIKDCRPRWEHKSVVGPAEFVALEECSPPPWYQVSRTLAAMPDSPAEARFELQSFQITIKDRELASSGGDIGVGMTVDRDSNTGKIRPDPSVSIPIDWITEPIQDAVESSAQRLDLLFKPPRDFGHDCPCDVSCTIKGRLLLTWADGHKRELAIDAFTNSGPREDDALKYRGDAIDKVIQSAVTELTRDLMKKTNSAGNPPP
jgi:hypothetical protein